MIKKVKIDLVSKNLFFCKYFIRDIVLKFFNDLFSSFALKPQKYWGGIMKILLVRIAMIHSILIAPILGFPLIGVPKKSFSRFNPFIKPSQSSSISLVSAYKSHIINWLEMGVSFFCIGLFISNWFTGVLSKSETLKICNISYIECSVSSFFLKIAINK